jgi:hypothetical protein
VSAHIASRRHAVSIMSSWRQRRRSPKTKKKKTTKTSTTKQNYRRLSDNAAFLRLAASTPINALQQKHLLRTASREQIEAICECAYNILRKNVPLSGRQEGQLRKYRQVVYKLVDKRLPVTKRKKLIVQQTGGFLPALLAPVIGAILGAVTDRLINR